MMGRMLNPFRQWVRRQRERGRLEWLLPVWVYAYNLRKYHSLRRFRNYWEYRFLLLSGRCQRLRIDGDIRNGVFYLLRCRAGGSEAVLKIPRFDNIQGRKLQQALRDGDARRRYAELLTRLASTPPWGRHFPAVAAVRSDGGYTSAHVRGHNLLSLRECLRFDRPLPTDVEPAALRRAVHELATDLEAYHAQVGRMIGDWALHNLIYASASGVIQNVDLEGQYLYDQADRSSDMGYIRSELGFLDTLLELRGSTDPRDRDILKTFAVVSHATGSGASYSGQQFHSGYHSLTLAGRYFRGQRECASRLAGVPFDFSAKAVLDIGCNCGGMLHALAGQIRLGIGIDYDYKCINAANLIRTLNATANLRFFTFDLQQDDLRLIDSYLLGEKVDLCMLLSICMWIRNWREVIALTARLADNLLFEANGSPVQQEEQSAELYKHFKRVEMLRGDSPDDTIQQARMLYLCSNAAATPSRVAAGAAAAHTGGMA